MTQKSLISNLLAYPRVPWGDAVKPIAIVDGAIYSIAKLDSPLSGSSAYVVGIGDKDFPRLRRLLDVESLYFYEMRVSEVNPLSQVRRLKHLAINWNTKLTDITCLEHMAPLDTLVLQNVSNVRDLSPLRYQSQLKALKVAGNLGSLTPRAEIETLEPIGLLPDLIELRLLNLRVATAGLRPIASCKALKRLDVSYAFDTEDYAFLSAKLPSTQSDSFSAFVPVERTDHNGNAALHMMIIGRRKPILDPRKDQKRIDAYVKKFEMMRSSFT